MRTGHNPHSIFIENNDKLKLKKKIPPQLPVVVVLTHLPDKSEYHSSRWEIVTKSLKLCRKNAGTDHYLVIWDNGSMPTLRKWLIDFNPDQLIFTENEGVVNGMRRILNMYHDTIVTWNNDDLIYYPNWLQPQIDILKAYPKAATVSGCTTRLYSNKADDKTEEWARDNAVLGLEDTPMQWDYEHGESIGKKRFEISNAYMNTKIRSVEYNGVKALIGGNHCQITCRPHKILPSLAYTDMYMYPLFQTLDVGLNNAGHLRLLTPERLTRHIGNVLTDDDRAEIDNLLESE